jgi:hypothetical protein
VSGRIAKINLKAVTTLTTGLKIQLQLYNNVQKSMFHVKYEIKESCRGPGSVGVPCNNSRQSFLIALSRFYCHYDG